MRSFVNRNVNGIYETVMKELIAVGIRENSRNGPVITHPSPVAVTYNKPRERVLFSRKRRANPFFHLFEAFWMLAGRKDSDFLNRYVKDFGSRYAEPSGNIWDAYGNRWCNHFGFDQLEWVIDLLSREPTSRQAVIQMYDADADSIREDMYKPKCIPCNTNIYLRLFNGERSDAIDPVLDLTVCCRSNDAIWGAYGANPVHFSVLLEYIAWRLDARMGSLHQLSNNLHVYESTLNLYDPKEFGNDFYSKEIVQVSYLFSGADQSAFHEELDMWLEDPSNENNETFVCEDLFDKLLVPMSRVHDQIKSRHYSEAIRLCEKIEPLDWKFAARQWIETRPTKVVEMSE